MTSTVPAANTLAVVCGASKWPGLGGRFVPAAAFANTATGLRDYLHAATGLSLPTGNLLWLFDSPATAVEHLDRIHRFLTYHAARAGGVVGRGLVVVFIYVGHGAFLGADRAYSLLLRDTHEPVPAETSLRVTSIASLLRTTVPESARIVILDSCFAGVALKDFQSDITQLASVKIAEALQHSYSSRGVALLCAASARNPARLAGIDTATLFGRALLHVLHTGDPDVLGPMSLRRVCELTARVLTDPVLEDAPVPEVHVPDQRHGDLAATPLFPNPATVDVAGVLPDALGQARMRWPSGIPDTGPPETRVLATTQQLRTGAAEDTVATLARRMLDEIMSVAPLQCAQLAGHTDWVTSVAFSPDGRLLATGSGDKTARLWDLATGQDVGDPLTDHTGAVTSVAFSPDGRVLATGSSDRTVQLWDLSTVEHPARDHLGHTANVSSVAFSPDGRLLVTSSQDGTVRVWDPATGQQVGDPLTGHTGSVWSVAFSPDGRLLATLSGDVQLWDTVTYRQVGYPFIGHTGPVQSVAFSPDGQLLATGSLDKTVRLWDPATGRQIGQPLTGHTESVRSVAFSPDGRLLASGSWDGTVRLWHVDTRHQIGGPLTVHHTGWRWVSSVTFSPDGQRMAIGYSDRHVRLWAIG